MTVQTVEKPPCQLEAREGFLEVPDRMKELITPGEPVIGSVLTWILIEDG